MTAVMQSTTGAGHLRTSGEPNEKTIEQAGTPGKLVKYGGLNGHALLYTIVGIATCGCE